MTQWNRVVLGFIFAPALPAVLLYGLDLLGGEGRAAWELPALLVPFAYAAALALGVPTYWLLRRSGRNSLISYAFGGVLIGLAVSVLITATYVVPNWHSAHEHAIGRLRSSPRSVIVSVGYAVVATGVFWLIAIKRLHGRFGR